MRAPRPSPRLRLVPVAAAILACIAGCGAHPDDSLPDEDDGALRALREGDFDEPLVSAVPAKRPPEHLGDVVTWDVHYVVMDDPKPEDRFNGVLAFARNAAGETRYLVPITLTERGSQLQLFKVKTEGADPAPISLDVHAADPAAAARAKAALDWLLSERAALGKAVQTTYPEAGKRLTPKAAIPLAGFPPQPTSASPMNKTYAKCAADLAVLALSFTTTNPLVYFVAQAAVDAAFGDYSSAGANAALGTATGAAIKVVESRGWETVKRATPKALGLAAAGYVVYSVYDEGLGAGLADAALALFVPHSCQESYASFTHVPPHDHP